MNEHNFLGVRKVNIRQLFENIGIINGRMPVCDFHMSPAFQRSEHHEQIGRAVALMFVIITRRSP